MNFYKFNSCNLLNSFYFIIIILLSLTIKLNSAKRYVDPLEIECAKRPFLPKCLGAYAGGGKRFYEDSMTVNEENDENSGKLTVDEENELLRLIAKYKKFVKYAKILTSLKNEEENDRLDNQNEEDDSLSSIRKSKQQSPFNHKIKNDDDQVQSNYDKNALERKLYDYLKNVLSSR